MWPVLSASSLPWSPPWAWNATHRRRVAAFLLAFSLILIARPTPAASDEIDIAVEAFAAVSTSIGFMPGEQEKEIIKTIVRCAFARTPVLDCGREQVVRV